MVERQAWVEAAKRLQDLFPRKRPSIEVVATGAGADELRAALGRVADRAVDERLAARDAQPGDEVVVSDDGRTALLTLAAPAPEGERENTRAIEERRDTVVPDELAALPGDDVEWAVGGGRPPRSTTTSTRSAPRHW